MRFAAPEAAILAVDRLRSHPWGLAVAVAADDDIELALDPGADDLNEDSYFQIGSVTKTMTGLLVADCITRGEASLDTTVGAILGDDGGKCGRITLLDLVTQHSGLRLTRNC